MQEITLSQSFTTAATYSSPTSYQREPTTIKKLEIRLISRFIGNYKIPPQAVLQIQKVNMANVVELKVGLHCDECIKKILKTIKKIEDIETYDIDTKLNKVTVIGNVTTEEVIRVLHKIGKQASVWDEGSANHIPK